MVCLMWIEGRSKSHSHLWGGLSESKASLGNSPKKGRKAGVVIRCWGKLYRGLDLVWKDLWIAVKRGFTWVSGRQSLFCRRSQSWGPITASIVCMRGVLGLWVLEYGRIRLGGVKKRIEERCWGCWLVSSAVLSATAFSEGILVVEDWNMAEDNYCLLGEVRGLQKLQD